MTGLALQPPIRPDADGFYCAVFGKVGDLPPGRSGKQKFYSDVLQQRCWGQRAVLHANMVQPSSCAAR